MATMCLVPELPNPEEVERWQRVASTLDYPSRSIRILPWTSALWMQEWLHYEVQMCQGCPKMYSAMFLLWRMLSHSLLSIYAYTCYVFIFLCILTIQTWSTVFSCSHKTYLHIDIAVKLAGFIMLLFLYPLCKFQICKLFLLDFMHLRMSKFGYMFFHTQHIIKWLYLWNRIRYEHVISIRLLLKARALIWYPI